MSHASDEDMQYLEVKYMTKEDINEHEQAEPLHVPQDAIDTPSCSGSEDFKWQHESVMLLCSLYKAKKDRFSSGYVKKRDLWNEIATEMSSQGFPVNLVICEKKWHNLCATYRKLKEFSRYSTKKRKCWPYFETFKELFNEDNDMQSTSINSALCRAPMNNGIAGMNIHHPQVPVCGQNLWPIQYHSQHQVDSVYIERGIPRSSGQDISSMLSVTLDESMDRSSSNHSNNMHSNSMHMPQQQCLDDFKWTHNSVMLLCSLYIARKEQFQSGAVKKRDLWTDIAQQMNQEGFPVTCTVCEKKWHNLIATYKKVILYNKKKTWPYLHIFQKILEEQTAHHMSFNNSEYRLMTMNNYPKEDSNNRICDKISVKEDISLLSPNDHTYGAHLNRNNDIVGDDFKWTHDSVISLCTLYKEKRQDFQSNTIRKRDLWLEVANEMNIQGYCVTWVHCEKKWYNLYATYKKVTDQNRKRVRIWSTWPYLRLFQDIFDKNQIEKDQAPHIPIHNTYESESGTSHDMCSPSSSCSERTCDMSQEHVTENMCSPNKKLCLETAPIWFQEYCEKQKEQEENRQRIADQQHRELLEAITKGNQAIQELTDNLKLYLNKCL